MARPSVVAVDDDPHVLRAVKSDLMHRYGEKYRVLSAESGVTALDLARTLSNRNEPVALFLVDQRMPQMNGTELLAEAGELFPDAKRILLTAYADTDAAIEAINRARIDYYLLKPWHPPEEKLFPILDDVLDDWQANYKPGFDGVNVIGYRWTRGAHDLRGFLARNQVPYRFLDLEKGAAARRLLTSVGCADEDLPVVVFQDGSALGAASPRELADKLGLKTQADLPHYDLAIVGAGPAGLGAAVYGASEGLRTVLIERAAPGGQAGESSRIENYLGFPSGISGSELSRRALAQVRRFGVDVLCPQEVVSVEGTGPAHRLKLSDGNELLCHALLVATGVSYRRLDAPGMLELAGAGVFYGAAATEAAGLAELDAYVVGGGNSAGQAAMYFSRFAKHVTLLVRGDGLTASMSRYLIDQIDATENVSVRTRSVVVEAIGDKQLQRLVLEDVDTSDRETVPAAGLFVFIGTQPHAEWLADLLRLDDKGFVLTGADLAGDTGSVQNWPLARDPYAHETNVPGIFAAGDVRSGSIKRVASGVGEGSVCVASIHQYLSGL